MARINRALALAAPNLLNSGTHAHLGWWNTVVCPKMWQIQIFTWSEESQERRAQGADGGGGFQLMRSINRAAAAAQTYWFVARTPSSKAALDSLVISFSYFYYLIKIPKLNHTKSFNFKYSDTLLQPEKQFLDVTYLVKATTPHNTSVTKPPDIMNDDETNTWKSTLLPKGTRGKHKQIPHDATHNIHKKAIGYHPTIHTTHKGSLSTSKLHQDYRVYKHSIGIIV